MKKILNIIVLLSCLSIMIQASDNQPSVLKTLAVKAAIAAAVWKGLGFAQNRCLPAETDTITRFFLAANNLALSTIITFPQISAKITIPVCMVSFLVTLAAVDHNVSKSERKARAALSNVLPSNITINAEEDKCAICHSTLKEVEKKDFYRISRLMLKPLCCRNGAHLICGSCVRSWFFGEHKQECPLCKQICPDFEIVNYDFLDADDKEQFAKDGIDKNHRVLRMVTE